MSYASPLLTIPEIVECFRESNITITENDIKNPDPRRWHDIYSAIFETLTDRPLENVVQSMLRVERMQTHYPELFEEGFSQMAFTRCMQRVLSAFGFTSFSLKDVVQPTASRVQTLTSVFVNAIRHIQGRSLFVQNTMDKIQAMKAQYESVSNTNRRLKEMLASAKKAQLHRDAENHRVQAEFEHEQQLLLDLSKVQEKERRAVDELKLRVSELDADKEHLKQQLTSVQLEMEKISHKIVPSPKRFRKDLEHYKKKMDDMKGELAKKVQSLSENRLLLEETVKKLACVVQVLKLSKKVQCDQDKNNELVAEIGCLTEGMHEQKECYNSNFLQEESLAEKLRVRQEQTHKLASQIDLQEQSACQQLTDLRSHHERLKEKIQNNGAETSQVSAANLSSSKELLELETALEDKRQELKRDLLGAAAEILTVEEVISQRLFEISLIGQK